MEVELRNYKDDIIKEFKDRTGKACSFQDFLKATGRYSSQYFLYLTTKKKEQCESDVNNNESSHCEIISTPTYLVNGNIAKGINVKYTKVTQSRYSSNIVTVTCNSIDECKMLSHSNEEDYNPLEDGFVPTYVAVDNTVYMKHETMEENVTIKFPQSLSGEEYDTQNILHGPEEVHGIDGCKLVLCVINKYVGAANYTWYRNDEIIEAGQNLSLITVNASGKYKVTIEIDNILYQWEPAVMIQVISGVGTEQNMGTFSHANEGESTPARSYDSVLPVATALLSQELDIKTPVISSQITEIIDDRLSLRIPANETDTVKLEVPANSRERTSNVSVIEMSASATHTTTLNGCFETPGIFTNKMPLGIQIDVPVIPPNTNRETTDISTDTITPVYQACSKSSTGETKYRTKQSSIDQVTTTSDMSASTSHVVLQLKLDTRLKSSANDIKESTINTKESTSNTKNGDIESSTSDTSACIGTELSNLNQNTELKTKIIRISSSEIHELTEINRGAFGIVMKGVWNGTSVALKKIQIRRLKMVKKMLQRELEVNASIRHPNIVLFMGYNMERAELHLISEYVDGPNLEQLLFNETNQSFSYENRLSVGLQISAAIAYLHSRRPVIVHRDIKPENIVLSKQLDTAKLCDMGLSKFKTMTTVTTTMASGSSTQPGTPVYQAPEMFLHRSSSSTATDMWSLSATAVELFSGEMIWELKEGLEDEAGNSDDDGSLENTMCYSMKLQQKPHGLVKLLQMDIPAKLKEIVTQGLDYSANNRPKAVTMCLTLKELMTS